MIQTYGSLEDPGNPCNDDEGIAVLGGIEEENHKRNCKDLKDMSTNLKVKAALEDLKQKTDIPDSEKGYSVSKNIYYTANEIHNDVPYTGVSMGFTLPYPPASDNAVSVMHTHPNDYLGYLMFSPQDFYYFYNIMSKHTVPSGQIKKYNDYSLIVVTHQGTYALKIEDPSKFIAAMGSYNKDFIQELEDYYQARHPMDPINLFEKDILGFMSDRNMGIELYKADDDLSNWNKLELNNNWDSIEVKYIPCK